jgi:hypothetical protein
MKMEITNRPSLRTIIPATIRLAAYVSVHAFATLTLVLVIVHGIFWSLPSCDLSDFGSFYASGIAASEGLDPYDVYPLTNYAWSSGFFDWNPNLNPPISVIFFEYITKFQPYLAFNYLWIMSFSLYVFICIFLLFKNAHLGIYYRALWLM